MRGERRLHLAHDRPFGLDAGVAPGAGRSPVAGPFVSDAEPARETDPPVDDDQLAVVAPGEAEHVALRRPEEAHVTSRLARGPHSTGSKPSLPRGSTRMRTAMPSRARRATSS